MTTFYHGTKAKLNPGDFIKPGHQAHKATGNPDGLVWFADAIEFAEFWGDELDPDSNEPTHIYEVAPTGPYEDDRAVATKQVPKGNYQSKHPLLVIREAW
jgi:hypothetical protein